MTAKVRSGDDLTFGATAAPRGQRVWVPVGRRLLAATTAVAMLTAATVPIALAQSGGEHPLGFRPLPRQLAAQFAAPITPRVMLPPDLDWRDTGIITPSKNQLICGGCWSFAAAGLMEAMAIMNGAPFNTDFSEQFAISCDTELFWGVRNDGCCGGTCTVFEFHSNNDAAYEADLVYGNGDFDGDNPRSCSADPPWSTIPCPDPYPAGSGWRVASWTLISAGVATVPELKTALQDGPVWLGYYVYDDFDDFWNTAGPDDVYTYTYGELRGGHAVLLIGYDDTKEAWIIKNSWGVTGPSGDGSCWISYTAGCDFGINATTITMEGLGDPQAVCCFEDGSCLISIESYCIGEGGTWHSGWGSCDPNPCPQPTAVCCMQDGSCQLLTEALCGSASGTWHSEWSTCDPNPCPQPEAVCCFGDGSCQILTETDCIDASGEWLETLESCTPNPCELHVCCVGTDCSIVRQDECVGLGGDFFPAFSTCDPNPCGTPTNEPGWGNLKSLFGRKPEPSE